MFKSSARASCRSGSVNRLLLLETSKFQNPNGIQLVYIDSIRSFIARSLLGKILLYQRDQGALAIFHSAFLF